MNPLILDKLADWKRDPVLFVREVLKVEPSSQQMELLHGFRKAKRHSVRSGHGTGKDACASWLILWFMTLHPYAKVMCTAPTAHQLDDILWSEISKWIRTSEILSSEFVVQKQKIFHKSAPKEWWCRAVSVKINGSQEEQAETLAGRHGDNLLIVVDEASGVPDPVFIPIAGAMTQENNKCLLIGNPTKNTGEFHNTQFDPKTKEKWATYHWDSRFSTNVTEDMIEYFRDKFGEDSNVFRIRVMGEPPIDSYDTFIPLAWAIQCIGNPIKIDPDWPTVIGCDVAGDGGDDCVFLPLTGGCIVNRWVKKNGLLVHEQGARIVQVKNDYSASLVGVDGDGIGYGIVNWLQNDPAGLGIRQTMSIKASTASSNNRRWARLRDEMWDGLREKCMKSQFSFPDITVKHKGMDINIGHELANELATPKHSIDKNGAIKVEAREKIIARLGHSPDIASALCIANYISNMAFSMYQREERIVRQRRHNYSNSTRPRRHSWMSV